jgi:SpoVK/Ycf46/Vps4 family AAA+-type ATPase
MPTNVFSTWQDAAWIQALRELYRSGAINTFLLHGNTADRFVGPDGQISNLRHLLEKTALENFEIILGFNFVQGVHIVRGNALIPETDRLTEALGKTDPYGAIHTLNVVAKKLIGVANKLGKRPPKIAVVIEDTHTIAPATSAAGPDYELAALIATIKSWSGDDFFRGQEFCALLITENLTQVNPALTTTSRIQDVKVEMPDEGLLTAATRIYLQTPATRAVLPESVNIDRLGEALRGVTLQTWESCLLLQAQREEKISLSKVGELKRKLIERDAQDLLEFIPPTRNFADLQGMEEVKKSLAADLQLWRDGEIDAVPKGMVICGPVGTGKSFTVECIAGEAGVPTVKLKNFRNMWYGSTEGNLEKIFRLLRALGRVIVFIDEADQTLGKRDNNANDGGLSGRIYSMMAQEMGSADTRGKIMWILASSRPDLIEVDLKRPGRVDVKIPLLPTATQEQSLALVAALAKRRKIAIDPQEWERKTSDVVPKWGQKSGASTVEIPTWLTPGGAEAIATHMYKIIALERRAGRELSGSDALVQALAQYQAPISRDTMRAQIQIALNECTNKSLVPAEWREFV